VFVTLQDISYCPKASDNLISEGRIDKAGSSVLVKGGICTVKNKARKTIMVGNRRNNLYEMDCVAIPKHTSPSNMAFFSHSRSDLDLWHRHLAHLNIKHMCNLVKYDMVIGLDSLPSKELAPCTGCVKGNHPQSPFPNKASHADSILELLHMDLQGPFDTTSWLGYRYTLGIVDDNSHHSWKYYQKHKDEASDNIEEFITEAENQVGLNVKRIWVDGGGEFLNKEVRTFCKRKGIVIETSTPWTPQQNGIAEQFNCTTHSKALAMLQELGLPKAFWPEAHEFSNRARNMSPMDALPKLTPHQAFTGSKPDVSTFRVFGSKCHVRIAPELRKKLDAQSLDGIFCGFAKNSKAYKVWIPSKHKFVTSCDVVVYEKAYSQGLGVDDINIPSQGVPSTLPVPSSGQIDPLDPESDTLDVTTVSSPAPSKHTYQHPPEESHPNPDEPCQPRTSRPMWKLKDPKGEGFDVAYSARLSHGDTPLSYEEATASPDATQWMSAMQDEYDMLT
jgi:hypothetical protein